MSSRLPRVAPPGGPGSAAVAGLALLLAASAALAGCGTHDVVHIIDVGDVVDASATAAVGAHPVQFMVPSGRITVTVSNPLTSVSPLDTADGASLRAAPGAALLGVTWTLDRGTYPDLVNVEVASPATLLGVPRDVDLTLVVGGRRIVVPDVGTMGVVGNRTTTTVWLGVPGSVAGDLTAPATSYPPGTPTPTPSPRPDPDVGSPERATVELGYDGLTQLGDVQTGVVSPSVATPLDDPLPLARSATCEVSGHDAGSCLLDYAIGYPYVDGVGWAPRGTTYAAVAIRTGGALSTLTLGGRNELTSVTDGITTVDVFDVQSGSGTGPGSGPLELRGEVQRGSVQRELSARVEASTP